jgi:hypothetical protein
MKGILYSKTAWRREVKFPDFKADYLMGIARIHGR